MQCGIIFLYIKYNIHLLTLWYIYRYVHIHIFYVYVNMCLYVDSRAILLV